MKGCSATNYWAQKINYMVRTSAQNYLHPKNNKHLKQLHNSSCDGGGDGGGDCSIGCGTHSCDSPGCNGSCSG